MPKTITQYTEQREGVLNRLLEILEIDEKNNMISLKKTRSGHRETKQDN